MHYIILDLEWNQASESQMDSITYPSSPLHFEIIEIGAVKVDLSGNILGEFGELIRPVVYPHLFERIREVVKITEEDLLKARSFPDVWKDFISWCGTDCRFCTWGSMDLTELQRNIDFYGLENPFPLPLLYYDIQKLYSLAFEDGKVRRALDYAIHALILPEQGAFHRALSDAYYTWMVMDSLDMDSLRSMVSIDYHRPPRDKKEEIYLKFETYSKFVSRIFSSKEDAMMDKNVTSTVCYQCGHAAKRKIRWFSNANRHYFSLSYCPDHGWLKGKIRMKKAEDNSGVYAVKILKLVDESSAFKIFQKQQEIRKKRKLKHQNELSDNQTGRTASNDEINFKGD